ncbi:MAG TPA: hypothetical protein VJT82_03755, partial [Pyrinomonadaceae bacterium]|nr:hypothetical protein [Pyrinomonadaceae bacterium]
FGSHFKLLSEVIGGNDESLAAGAGDFLERTASVYASNLYDRSLRHLSPAHARAPVYADSLYLTRLAHFDRVFPASDLRATYEAAMEGFGIRVERQGNVRVETAANASGKTRAACFALNPPYDVRIVFQPRDGASFYRAFFETGGRAQHFAWVSRDLATRYPELVHAPDDATRAGFAFLFGDLVADEAWLVAHRNVKPSQAREIAHALALVESHRTRFACARLRHLHALDEATDARSEQLAEAYANAVEEATGFRHHPALHLRDTVSDDLREAGESRELSPAVHLRARLFAAALGEHLRTRYGARWWATRKAADELIDMWNTGSRYTIEELASLVGAGRLSFELLADSTQAALGGE